MKQPFSKTLLILDYIITITLLAVLVICAVINGLYITDITREMLLTGTDIYAVSVPFDLSALSAVTGVWAAQLGISSSAYYILVRSDHKIEYPIRMIGELPEDVRDKVDYDALIANVLSATGN